MNWSPMELLENKDQIKVFEPELYNVRPAVTRKLIF
jgi:hypothetical protein